MPGDHQLPTPSPSPALDDPGTNGKGARMAAPFTQQKTKDVQAELWPEVGEDGNREGGIS
ncbi:MAG: hypothetical protein CTY20_13785 [Hyphomicrobium sp.]|nr:MAG: hypothetical protein CTY20_13785 [Hyphomicrobium sp.]